LTASVDPSPLVSVVLFVRNGAADLRKAVDTILAQTFSGFELIAINDGSTDGTAPVLDGLRDPRVRVVHQDGVGLAAALNRGITLAGGRYIARQDHDDWAMPTRLEKQVAFLEPRCSSISCSIIRLSTARSCCASWHSTLSAAIQPIARASHPKITSCGRDWHAVTRLPTCRNG
jgi:glycosyltransferase involved in cell wall biosynthesis